MRKRISPPKQDSQETRSRAFNYSLKYLSYRPRSVKEIYDYLIRKNFAEDTISHVLKKLTDLKFLDDEEFAKAWIRSRQIKGKSKFIIKNELRLKGLTNELIEPFLKEAKDDLEAARELFEKKKKSLGKLPKEELKRKISGFLQRRGYSWEMVSKLFKD
jgi:regulatory protein